MEKILEKGAVVTLFTSDIKKTYFWTIIIYVIATIFTVIFNAVYYQFSHEVSSRYMSLAFLYPLLMGVIVYAGLFFINWFDKVAYNAYNAGVATITMASILLGVNEIAGADTIYYKYFYLVAFVLFGVSIIYPLVKLIINRHKKGEV